MSETGSKAPMILTPDEARRRAKVAIVCWFKARNPQEPSKPSDMARALGMDPDVARVLCRELIAEGVLGKNPSSS